MAKTTARIEAWILLATTLMVACYTAGRAFPSFSREALRLRETRLSEVQGLLREPESTGHASMNGKEVVRLHYSWASAHGFALGKGPLVRAASFYFVDELLVGYLYTSNMPGDSTAFDEGKIDQIEKGKSLRSDVEKVLG